MRDLSWKAARAAITLSLTAALTCACELGGSLNTTLRSQGSRSPQGTTPPDGTTKPPLGWNGLFAITSAMGDVEDLRPITSFWVESSGSHMILRGDSSESFKSALTSTGTCPDTSSSCRDGDVRFSMALCKTSSPSCGALRIGEVDFAEPAAPDAGGNARDFVAAFALSVCQGGSYQLYGLPASQDRFGTVTLSAVSTATGGKLSGSFIDLYAVLPDVDGEGIPEGEMTISGAFADIEVVERKCTP